MIPSAKVVDKTLTVGHLGYRWRRSRRILSQLFHLFSQAERPHVGPYFFNVSKAFCFDAAFPRIFPPERIFLVLGPDGILLLMVDYNFVDCLVLVIRMLERHLSSSLSSYVVLL